MFTLLYRQSRDGEEVTKFRELCNGKGPTIAVGKLSDTDEILGGYNPLSWGSDNGYAETNESFIFALDKNMDKSIVSFVDNSSKAIYDEYFRFPNFGESDLCFGGGYNFDRVRPHAKRVTYQLSIRRTKDNFKWADWEVFSVSNL